MAPFWPWWCLSTVSPRNLYICPSTTGISALLGSPPAKWQIHHFLKYSWDAVPHVASRWSQWTMEFISKSSQQVFPLMNLWSLTSWRVQAPNPHIIQGSTAFSNYRILFIKYTSSGNQCDCISIFCFVAKATCKLIAIRNLGDRPLSLLSYRYLYHTGTKL